MRCIAPSTFVTGRGKLRPAADLRFGDASPSAMCPIASGAAQNESKHARITSPPRRPGHRMSLGQLRSVGRYGFSLAVICHSTVCAPKEFKGRTRGCSAAGPGIRKGVPPGHPAAGTSRLLLIKPLSPVLCRLRCVGRRRRRRLRVGSKPWPLGEWPNETISGRRMKLLRPPVPNLRVRASLLP